MEVTSEVNNFEFYSRNESSANTELSDEYSESVERKCTQLMDSFTSFRFIEPEVIIKEFSIETLQALKNKRFDKEKLSLQCPVCDKTFQRNSHLKRHILIHTKEKPFKCDICDREFNQSSTMKSHKISVHSKLKPFLCTEPNCTKSFSIASNLRMHQKSHLSGKELTCKHCTRSFKYQNSLKAHEKIHILNLIHNN